MEKAPNADYDVCVSIFNPEYEVLSTFSMLQIRWVDQEDYDQTLLFETMKKNEMSVFLHCIFFKHENR